MALDPETVQATSQAVATIAELAKSNKSAAQKAEAKLKRLQKRLAKMSRRGKTGKKRYKKILDEIHALGSLTPQEQTEQTAAEYKRNLESKTKSEFPTWGWYAFGAAGFVLIVGIGIAFYKKSQKGKSKSE